MIGTQFAEMSSTFYRFPHSSRAQFRRSFSQRRRSPSPARLLPLELTDLLGLDRHEELPLLQRRLRRRIRFGFAVRQVGHDLHQPLPEPGMREGNVPSLIDADPSPGIGIQGRSGEDELAHERLSQEDEHAGAAR